MMKYISILSLTFLYSFLRISGFQNTFIRTPSQGRATTACDQHTGTGATSSSSTSPDQQEIRDLFSKYCDDDGYVGKETIEMMPPFVELLRDGDLLQKEFNDIWDASPKFLNDSSRVDELSFIQIYLDVDDLFEEYDEDEDNKDRDDNSSNIVIIEGRCEIDDELSKVYKSICNDRGLISKDLLRQWDEIQNVLEEGLLSDGEFDDLFEKAAEDEILDVRGFSKFNLLLDDLFEDDDSIDNEKLQATAAMESTNSKREMIIESDLQPSELFFKLCDENNLVGMNELNLWLELKEMVEEALLLPSEMQEIFDKHVGSSGKLNENSFLKFYQQIDNLFEEALLLPSEMQEIFDKHVGSSGKLNENSFLKFYQQIDNLFEDDEFEEMDSNDIENVEVVPKPSKEKRQVKEDLLSFLEIIQEDDDEPCGLGTMQTDQDQLLNIVNILEREPTNKIIQKNGKIEPYDVAGNWELLYTSSSAMKFNKGLSGIGGSFPNGRFAGMKQELKTTKFISDMQYKERIEVTPSSASFDVTVNGSWDLRTSVSLFTGQPSIILYVEPDKVSYGPTSTRADHWKSLGPLNRLDISYLDDNLRVMRGCTSSETVFIYRKVS